MPNTVMDPAISRMATHEELGSPRSCDTEPIHIPGFIQPHGLLLLFDAASGKLRHRAGDGDGLLGLATESFPSAHELLNVSIDDLIVSCLLNQNDEPVYVGIVRPCDRRPLAMMVHRTGCFVAVELFQAEVDGSVASALDFAGTMIQRINSSQSLDDACSIVVEQVRAIVGFDSVLIYRFLNDGSGSVIAESRTERARTYLGHRFPASDIPRQARELYRNSLIRLIPDVAYQPARLEPAPIGVSVDMSHCILRSVSRVHIEFMKNMGLGASLSISLMAEGQLWGLIICHHYEPRLVQVQAQLFCRIIGTALSGYLLKFERAEEALLGAVQSDELNSLLEDLRTSSDPERRLRTSCHELKRLIDCSGFVLLDEGEFIAGAGRVPGAETLRKLAPFLGERLQGRLSYSTDRVGEEFPDMPMIADDASGILAIRLEGWRPMLAIWLRPEQIEEIDWAGEPPPDEGTAGASKTLTPRHSFATWRQIVRGRSKPWPRREIEAAGEFQRRMGYAMQRHRLGTLNAELCEANTLLNTLATTDPLTGLPNRRLFDERLSSEWERARRQGSGVALVSIDIDHFKAYNDRFGHPAGDECLKRVARAIGDICRVNDLAARLGGEEFVVLLPGIDGDGAHSLAERVRVTIEGLGIEHPHSEHGLVTISLGVAAAMPSNGGEATELLSMADRSLYHAKEGGRNKVN